MFVLNSPNPAQDKQTVKRLTPAEKPVWVQNLKIQWKSYPHEIEQDAKSKYGGSWNECDIWHVPESQLLSLGKFGLPSFSPPGGHSLLSVVACREAREYISDGRRGEEGDLWG